MNKSKTLSRKCAYCPHHSQQAKCCCHRPAKSAVNTKKSKPKPATFINESSIHLVPEQNQNFNHINLSNLLLQNSMLKQQNSHLQNNLLSISHCINEERFSSAKNYNIPTSTTLKTESDNLADRLYLSNKNLQQAIMKVDLLGRKNKDLNDKNVQLGSEIQTLKLLNEELKQDLATAKKQLKKAHDKLTDLKTSSSQCRPSTINQDYKLLREKYQNLKFQNSNLIDQIQRLKYQLSKSHTQSQESMSPEWIAQTSNKLTFIEQKIDLAESKLKTSQVMPQKQPQKNLMISEQNENYSNNAYFEMVYKLKKEVALAINTIHSKTRKFNSVFDQVGAVDNLNIKSLICNLLEGFVENCINLNLTLERQLTRKITVLQKRMDNLMGKLQNFVLEIKNRELRKRSTSRSRILINNKSRTHSKSPSALRVLKENTIPHNNSIDKSY